MNEMTDSFYGGKQFKPYVWNPSTEQNLQDFVRKKKIYNLTSELQDFGVLDVKFSFDARGLSSKKEFEEDLIKFIEQALSGHKTDFVAGTVDRQD